MTTERVDASPTKEFFISMITRDISLEDCILDLLDNSIDGARASIAKTQPNTDHRFEGFKAEITTASDSFVIKDNCGGIPIEQARAYAFHFGRRRDAPASAPDSIGLYGIGMKRAMFKLGRTIMVKSSTQQESFSMAIDVEEWAKDEKNWDFLLESGNATDVGTALEIVDLNEGVGEEFADQVFSTGLNSIIARDYSLVLQAGFEVYLNGNKVVPFAFGWLSGDDFEPMHETYEDDGVEVDIIAGLSRIPSDDDSPGDAESLETKYYGWFVVCNDRVVVAGDKSDLTVWGDELFPAWHPQYNGFTGTVHFKAPDPIKLPWKTTKRGVDETSPLYRRAISRMKDVTRTFIAYTNARKLDLEEAKRKEQAARLVTSPPQRPELKLPSFAPAAAPRVRLANIAYQVSEREFVDVARALGNERMARKDVGLRTFQFFKERMGSGEA